MTTAGTMWRTVAGAGIAALLAVAPTEARSGGASASELSGTVDRVDPGSGEISLSGTEGTLTVTDETQIVKDGHRAALSDVREGDEVRASYSGSGETLEASRIEVVGGPSFTDQG